MEALKYTLIGDGSSDKSLINIIEWLLNDLFPELPTKWTYADFTYIKNPPGKGDIKNQIAVADQYFPFDLLFYHRDAEGSHKNIVSERKEEVYKAVPDGYYAKTICVVPYRNDGNMAVDR